MALKLVTMHGLVAKEIASTRTVRESMDRIIGKCAKGHPHEDWKKLAVLPYDDLDDAREWIEKPFREEPPQEKLAGLWFGLFNPVYGREPAADIYVCGATRFDSSPDDNSWAVGPDWWPESRYAESAVLAKLYRIAYRKDGLGNVAEYPLCLAYGGLVVRDLLRDADPCLFLGSSPSLGIAVGFDSGDFVLLGQLTDAGLTPIDPDAKRPEVSIEPVLQGLRSSDGKKVFRAVFELHRLGDRARAGLPDLLRIATSAEFGLRQAAVNMLAAIAPDDPRSRAAALQALHDSSPFVRREALQALISIKGLSRTDLVRIKDMENDSDEDVARWSEIALRNIRLQGKIAKQTGRRRQENGPGKSDSVN